MTRSSITHISRPPHSSRVILPEYKEGTDGSIVSFLAAQTKEAKAKGFVLGVSGGLDSAVVMRLCARAVGKENVLGLLMPAGDSLKEDIDDAKMLCSLEGVEHEVLDISRPVDAFVKAVGGHVERLPLGNIKARCRMVVLYYFANARNRLVAGTSNKSELMMGYFTKYGDGGADVEPLGDLYKTQVRQLAKRMGVPDRIIQKAPSAGLWKGQTDEGEMGITYERLDSILSGLELGFTVTDIAKRAETSVDEVSRIAGIVRSTSHKREMPPFAKV